MNSAFNWASYHNNGRWSEMKEKDIYLILVVSSIFGGIKWWHMGLSYTGHTLCHTLNCGAMRRQPKTVGLVMVRVDSWLCALFIQFKIFLYTLNIKMQANRIHEWYFTVHSFPHVHLRPWQDSKEYTCSASSSSVRVLWTDVVLVKQKQKELSLGVQSFFIKSILILYY